MTLQVKAKWPKDGARGGCINAPTGSIEIRGVRYRQPCNSQACQYCDPLRVALRGAAERAVALEASKQRRRLLSGVGR